MPTPREPTGSTDIQGTGEYCSCGERFEILAVPNSSRRIRTCPKCAENNHYGHEAEKLNHTNRIADIGERIGAIGIGMRFRGMTFDDYRPVCAGAMQARKACVDFADNFKIYLESGDGLILLGGVGTGKNMLAAIIAQEVVKQGFGCIHTTVMRLIRRIKETWRNGASESEQAVLRYFTAPDLLILDEIGVQFGSETEKLLLTEVINDRYEAVKPTILITNLSYKQLADYLGSRVMDRFGNSHILVFNWESWRSRGGLKTVPGESRRKEAVGC